ncbi:MAG TPA: hypothetical protein VFC76_06670 [Oscillospiraceae bacterium]|nr:hypothetical protein [Oscillospiraceae bacterium]
MKKISKKLLIITLTLVLTISFTATVFAAKTSDTKTKSHSEFGVLTGYEYYAGKIAGRKTITFGTKISKLSPTSIDTKLYARVDIHDYDTGVYRTYDVAPTVINKMETSYYWESHSDITNNRLISSFGTSEARRSGSAAVYTEIYGF